jgi:DNA-binding MurR/RpiR family transcriptional regulator
MVSSLKAKSQASPDIIAVVLDHEPTLSRTNRKIAHAIVTEPRAFVEKPVDELVGWLGVSAPTITRFARALDCEGLRDLKLKIMGSMRVGPRYLDSTTPATALNEAAERVLKRAQNSIANAHQHFDLALAEQAIEAISNCRTLYAFGNGGVSSWLVEEVQNRFFRLGVRTVPSADSQMQMMLAATVERDDVVLGISLSGRNQDLLRALEVAREYGATTMALTSAGSPVAGVVDLALPVKARDDGDILGPTSMRYAFLIAIDVLAYGAAIYRNSAAREKLRRIKQQVMTFADTDTPQPLSD